MPSPSLLAALLLAAAAAAAPVHAQTPAPAAPQLDSKTAAIYATNLRTIMDAMNLFDTFSATPLAGGSPIEREFDVAFRRQMTHEELLRRLQPAFAQQLTPQQAATLAPLLNLPAMRKREARGRVAPGNVTYGSSYFTAAEAAELRRADATPAIVAWRAQQPKLRSAITAAMTAWSVQFGTQLRARFFDVLRKVSADLAAERVPDAPPRKITVGRAGVPYLDQLAWVIASSLIKISNADGRFDSEMKRQGFADVLKPEYLASPVSRAHSQAALTSIDAALEVLLHDVDSALKEREEAIRTLALADNAGFTQSMSTSLGNLYGFYVDFGEANRRVLDQYRRVLAFFDAKQASVHIKDGKLQLGSDADIATARELFANIDTASADLMRIIEAQQAKERGLMDKYGSATAAAKAGDAPAAVPTAAARTGDAAPAEKP